MTIESAISDLTSATTTLTTNVAAQQVAVESAVTNFTAVIDKVNNDLSDVDNTTDLNKPVSDPQQTLINTKQDTLVEGQNISTVNGQSLLSGVPLVIVRSATSLSALAYEARSSLRSTTPEVDDSILVEGLGLFIWIAITNNGSGDVPKREPDDDETCFNTAAGQWLLRTPSLDLLAAYALIEDAVTQELAEDESIRFEQHLINRGL